MSSDVRLPKVEGLREGLKRAGYVEGVNLRIDLRNARADRAKLLPIARGLVAWKVDLICATGGIEADAAREATLITDIPVVFIGVASVLKRGLVNDLKHPGGNITGIDNYATELTPKSLEWLKRLVPAARRVMIIYVPDIVPAAESIRLAKDAAAQIGVTIVEKPVNNLEDIRAVVRSLAIEPPDGILTVPCAPVTDILEAELEPALLSLGIPLIAYDRVLLTRGVLATHGTSYYDEGVQASRIVAKILKGARPAEIPVEKAQRVVLAINMRLANEMRWDIPADVLALADELVY